MSFDPSLFPGGPAYYTRGGATFQSIDDSWKFTDKSKTFNVNTNLRGNIGTRIDDIMGTISMNPIATTGNLAAMLAALVPYRQADVGKLIYPSSDVTGVIQTKLGGTSNAGQSLTFARTALTKEATLTCAPNKELLGGVEWTALLKSGSDGSTAGDFYAVADSTYTAPTLSILTRLFDTYTLAYGATPAAPFDDIAVDDSGIVVTPAVTLEPVVVSKFGMVNMRITGVTLEISFRPVQMTLANFQTLFKRDGTGIGRGKPSSTFGGALSLLGSGTGKLSLQVPNVTVKPGSAGLEFNARSGFVDRITLEANATDSTGAFVELFTLGVIS